LICYCFNVEREEMDRLLASGSYANQEQERKADRNAVEHSYAFFHQKMHVQM